MPTKLQRKVPRLIVGMGSSNSLVSILSFQSLNDTAPRVPRRQPSMDMLNGLWVCRTTRIQSCSSDFKANARFDHGCCNSQRFGSTSTIAISSLLDGLGRISPITKRMKSTRTSNRLLDLIARSSDDAPPTIPQRRPTQRGPSQRGMFSDESCSSSVYTEEQTQVSILS